MEPILTLKNINKTFEDRPGDRLQALKDIDLEIMEGEFFIMVGPSGSGKSTVLRVMSGLEKQFGGHLAYAPGISTRDMSFVFQQFALLPWLTVAENVEMGLVARDVPERARKERAAQELKRLGLEKFGHVHPRELSGGMKQRVGIARALATDPKIMFLDEPFSDLDSFTAEELRQEMLSIWEERKMTIIMVTHIVSEAIELGDRIAVFTPRPGKVERVVVNKLARPRKKRSPDFFKLEDELYEIIKP